MSWLLVLASRLVSGGPTRRYPYGREALTPLVIGVQGFVLLATVAYAAADAVLTISEGGTEVTAGWGLAYALFSAGISVALWCSLERVSQGSDLLDAEAAAWRVGALLGVGIAVGFGVIALLQAADPDRIAPFVDPAMVLLTTAVLVPAAVAMVRTTVVEMLEGAPAPSVQAEVMSAVDAFVAEHGWGAPQVRMTKTGPKLYVEVDGVADPTLSIREENEARGDLQRRLDHLPFDVWLNFELLPNDASLDDSSAQR